MGIDATAPRASPLRGYLLATLLSVAFVVVRLVLEPVLQGQAPYVVLLGAPVLAAWFGGLGPGLAATMACAAAGYFGFAPEVERLTTADAVKVGIFLTYASSIAWLVSSRKTAITRLAAENALLAEAQARLAERERRVRQTLEASPSGMVVADRTGRIRLVNREAERLFGYTRAELQALSVDALVPDRVRPHHPELRQQYEGEPVHRVFGPERELFARRKDGTEFPVQLGLSPLEGDEGLVLASVLDISQQREAEAALRLSQGKAVENAAMFQSLADNIAQLAWMADAEGRITWFNRRWFEYTGAQADQVRGWGWQWVHHPDHVARVMAKFRRHIASGEPWEDTFPLRAHDGQYRWFLSRAFPLHDQSGRIVSWFGTNTDVTAQRQAEEALRDADRRKDEFIAVLAHELRNPLAPVRNAVEILHRIGVNEPRMERARDVIGRQVTHMARLIDDLLDVSRIARGKLTLRKEPCDLAAIVCQTAEDYRSSLEAAGQQLVLHGCDGPAWVEGDPVRLAQMLGNLLTNAARFSDGPGRVDVHTRIDAAHGQVRIGVRDTGLGMDEEMLGRLFDPFAQATQDMARSKGGLGLGLALTRGLAELHGGGVMAESEGLGRGSRFTLVLPLSRPPRPRRDADAEAGEGDSLRILVIEDNHDAAATLGELLQLGGHQVELAFDGASGIAKAREMRPDVVISDIGLPGQVSGYDVGRTLRDDPALEGAYLVALSGYADATARRRCTEAGFDAHLAKPPDIGALEQVLVAVQGRLARTGRMEGRVTA